MTPVPSLILLISLIPVCVHGTAYYEVTSGTGETTIQPFLSLPQSSSGYFQPAAIVGGGVAFAVTLFILFCCGGGSKGILKEIDHDEEDADEEELIVPAPAKKNATSTLKRAARDVNGENRRIIAAAEGPWEWGPERRSPRFQF